MREDVRMLLASRGMDATRALCWGEDDRGREVWSAPVVCPNDCGNPAAAKNL